MVELKPNDVTRISERLGDGRRWIRYLHEPTGVSIEDYAGQDEPISKVNERLFEELQRRVAIREIK
jgi:hypothetical protein